MQPSDKRRYLWPLGAAIVGWYVLDFVARFPAWISLFQVGVILVLAALTWRLLRWPATVQRLSQAFLISAIGVGQVHRLLSMPFAFFFLLFAGIALGIAIARRAAPRGAWRDSPGRALAVWFGLLAVGVTLPFGMMQYAVWRGEALSAAGVALEGYEAAGPPYPETRGDRWNAAAAYEPFWMFSAGERWYPRSAERYLRDPEARLVNKSGEKVPAAPVADAAASDTDACRTARSGPCRVTIQCKDESHACAADTGGPSVVYAHVIDTPLEAEGLRSGRSLVGRVRRVIEYWAFYRYDAWRGWAGLFHQWHESDWEAVVVGLGADTPLFVAFSSHCGGSWRTWNEVGGMAGRRTEDGRLVALEGHPRGHHPLAFVGEGTHATFPDDAPRQPDWNSCAKKVPLTFHVATFGPTYGAGVREHLDQVDDPDDFYGPRIIPVRNGKPAFMRFQGTWAVEDHLDILGDHSRGGGPPSPPLQALWRRPLWTIFCGDYWTPKTECAALRHLVSVDADDPPQRQ